MSIPAAAEPPLVVTAHLDAASFALFDDLRQRYFPFSLNKIPAHLSLFHQLPDAELRGILATLGEVCAGRGPIELRALPPRLLGRGVALAYEAEELSAVHRALAQAWGPWLTPQDRQPFRAHVTIQNKVAPAAARALFEAMRQTPPIPCRVEGIDVWQYQGGPWTAVACLPFHVEPSRADRLERRVSR